MTQRQHPPEAIPSERGVFCNRTLNLRSIEAIGYDMDYTLVHYHVEAWERRAYEYLQKIFTARGWPVGHLRFDPGLIERGLVVDTEQGNIVKANRFGFVKRALHGTRLLSFAEQRDLYARTIVDISAPRWSFLNTLFELSRGCFYAQTVELLDQRKLPEVLGYAELYDLVRKTLDEAHMEGRVKAEIVADPDRFVVLDPETPLTLLDQRYAGKKLILITNSPWLYTLRMMSYTFDRFLPDGMSWRDLFDIVIVGARKPSFFTGDSPFFEIATEDGLLRPAAGPPVLGGAYLGGNALELEQSLGLTGDEILYIGDHMSADVHVSKNVLRWRTALILRELEEEIQAASFFRPTEARLATLMDEKEDVEADLCQARVALQRLKSGYDSPPALSEEALTTKIAELQARVAALDQTIAPLARAASELNNSLWGLLMRTGNDKSLLAYQMERFADVYTSRVSNFLAVTPFGYLRSQRGSLPHDPSLPGGRPFNARDLQAEAAAE